MTAYLERITVYPIKSFDGIVVQEVDVLAGGALANDRRFALVDADERYLNGKRTPAVHGIRATFDLAGLIVRLRANDGSHETAFSLSDDQAQLGKWFSDQLGVACTLVENATSGFPDDTDSPGPTLISTATLETVSSWFPGLSLDEARRRFRANLEIGGVEPFWEDRLFGPSGVAVPFTIGESHWLGANPCQRCVVPSRGSETGEVTAHFQKTFATNRERSLPPWAETERFNHFYRLAVNTRPAADSTGGYVRIGDRVTYTV